MKNGYSKHDSDHSSARRCRDSATDHKHHRPQLGRGVPERYFQIVRDGLPGGSPRSPSAPGGCGRRQVTWLGANADPGFQQIPILAGEDRGTQFPVFRAESGVVFQSGGGRHEYLGGTIRDRTRHDPQAPAQLRVGVKSRGGGLSGPPPEGPSRGLVSRTLCLAMEFNFRLPVTRLHLLPGALSCGQFHGATPPGHIPVCPEGRSSLLVALARRNYAFRGKERDGVKRRL